MKRIVFSMITSAIAAIILMACNGGSSNASTSGLTQAQVQSMITAAIQPLASEITTLQSQVQTLQNAPAPSQPAVYITAPNATAYATRSVTRAVNTGGGATRATSTCNGIGTLTGRPSDSNPIDSDLYSGVSCAGYYFTISAASAGGDGYIQAPTDEAVFFDAANCTGNMYLATNFIPAGGALLSIGAVTNGAVFALNPAQPNTTGSSYFYIPANEAQATVTSVSTYYNGSCTPTAFPGSLHLYQLLPNDPTVTGIQSAPVPGPVMISN